MLPELIEIVPLDKPVKAEITVPGSKSITNRALILAALADGETTLQGALWSEDTQVMVDCLKKLGFAVTMTADPAEFCNRTITVKGLGGKIPNAGTAEKPLELFVGNAGTAARFLSAFVCLGNGVYRLHGVPRMHERPQAALFKALRELGYRVDSENGNDKLPARVVGEAPFSGRSRGNETHAKSESQSLLTSAPTNEPRRSCTVSIAESSQFASALLLCAKTGGWNINIVGENAEESPYVAMTTRMIEAFPKTGGVFQIEPDASSGSYFLAAGKVAEPPEFMEYSEQFGVEVKTQKLQAVNVTGWPQSGWQIDQGFVHFLMVGPGYHLFRVLEKEGALLDLERMKEIIEQQPEPQPNPVISRLSDLGDSIMTAIVVTPLLGEEIKFTDLGRLRLQETERVVALRTELTKCGAKVIEEGDTLTVYPSELHGAEIETYNDHRVAMCFAILGLKVRGIKIKNPACVKKTFPNFFQKLAAAPPKGLGATILDAKTGRKLEETELFAE
jgi:3-phosphoshikimate 1-carboxyvinyltransferase